MKPEQVFLRTGSRILPLFGCFRVVLDGKNRQFLVTQAFAGLEIGVSGLGSDTKNPAAELEKEILTVVTTPARSVRRSQGCEKFKLPEYSGSRRTMAIRAPAGQAGIPVRRRE